MAKQKVKKSQQKNQPDTSGGMSDNVRTFASLLLFVHLFCVAVVLSSNFIPSALQQRLVEVVAPYTKTLHLDPNFVPFQLTSGQDGLSRFHQWQVVDQNGKVTHRFPDEQLRFGFQRLRHDMFARVGGYYAMDESLDDEVAATMARDIARFVFSQDDGEKQFSVRCVRYIEDADPSTANVDSFSTAELYVADAWQNERGINVLKRNEARRTASPQPAVDDAN